MAYEFRRLEASEIDALDERFRVRLRHPPALLDSVGRSGIRTPLIVEPAGGSGGERFRLVSGWGRWSARPAGEELPCYILPSGLPAEGVWDIFLGDNDAWNVVEVARILKRLDQVPGLSVERIVTEKLKLLGVHASRDLHRRYLRLLDLGQAARDFIEEENLPLRRAAPFFNLPAAAVEQVVACARELRLTLNELGEMLELLAEIAHREGTDAAAVLAETGAAAAGAGKEKFRATLRARRFPELSRYRERLDELRREIAFSIPAAIEWDPQLERPGLRLFFELKDQGALEALERELAENRERLERFFEIL